MEHKEYTKINLGCQVTRTLLDKLGSPDNFLKIIHIAGSNGKGSVAEMLTSILVASGKKVGTFTSPQVYNFYDQFKINGQVIQVDMFEKYFLECKNISFGLTPTEFELQTATIINIFKNEGCEYAIIECGLGGLQDATNAINKKELAIITSITLEHTAYLGNTIKEICFQKSGIIKDCKVVVSYNQTQESLDYFKNLNANFPSEARITTECKDNEFIYDGKKFILFKHPTRTLLSNVATVIESARLLNIDDESIYKGILNTKIHGRVEEFILQNKTIVLDGGHNAQGLEPLCEYLNEKNIKPQFIFGCLKDKDIHVMLKKLSCFSNSIIAVSPKSVRAMEIKDITKYCEKYFKDVQTVDSVEKALNVASSKLIVVCGSFTLLKDAKQWIDKNGDSNG